jgi:DNA-binding LytR/AlgR family response regulator
MMNCIAIDDEPLALDVIENHLSKIPFVNLVAKVRNPLQAIEIINNQNIDFIFLDIQMPELTGIEFLKILHKKPLVIFTTAYPHYAVESYELNAIDYLVKPISFERLLKAILKVKEKNTTESLPIAVGNGQNTNDFIFVKTEYKTVKIILNDILYVESLKDYVVFHLLNEKISSLLSLTYVDNELPKDKFVRIHRSFIVAFDRINEIERNTLLIANTRITIGESYREDFKKMVEIKKL